ELSTTIMRGGAKPEMRKVKQGKVLMQQGKPGDELFFMVDGVVSVDVDGNVVAELGPGALLGERAVLEGGHRTAAVTALTPGRVSGLPEGGPYQGAVVLSHLHWDHTQGLPFFQAGDRTDSRVRLLMPEQGDAAEVLSRALSPPHFPIHPDGLRGAWTFDGLEPGAPLLEVFTVL